MCPSSASTLPSNRTPSASVRPKALRFASPITRRDRKSRQNRPAKSGTSNRSLNSIVAVYPFNWLSLLTSIEANVSRMRYTKIPSTITATITSKKIPSSTTSGIP